MTNLGLIGFGNFGRFLAAHLRPHFDVLVADARAIDPDEASRAGVCAVKANVAAAQPLVVLAVPVQHLEALLAQIAPHVAPDALVLDVSSVKMRPVELMSRALPGGTRIVGTHPLFGPQSGAGGITGLPVALCPARADETSIACVRHFLSRTLGLRVIETSPEEHDSQMAHVQGLTHLISRALAELNVPDSPLATVAYQRLIAMRSNLQHDSADLFMTIERENPFAAGVRRAFLDKLIELERRIGG